MQARPLSRGGRQNNAADRRRRYSWTSGSSSPTAVKTVIIASLAASRSSSSACNMPGEPADDVAGRDEPLRLAEDAVRRGVRPSPQRDRREDLLRLGVRPVLAEQPLGLVQLATLHQDPGEPDRCLAVRRVVLEHLRGTRSSAVSRSPDSSTERASSAFFSASVGRIESMNLFTSGSGYAPMKPVTASPSLKAITVGMLCTPNAEAVIWFASVSSFARRKAPCTLVARPSRGSASAGGRDRTTRPTCRPRPDAPSSPRRRPARRSVGDFDDVG